MAIWSICTEQMSLQHRLVHCENPTTRIEEWSARIAWMQITLNVQFSNSSSSLDGFKEQRAYNTRCQCTRDPKGLPIAATHCPDEVLLGSQIEVKRKFSTGAFKRTRSLARPSPIAFCLSKRPFVWRTHFFKFTDGMVTGEYKATLR